VGAGVEGGDVLPGVAQVGARTSNHQAPTLGQISITVSPGWRPKKASVSAGLRAASRARLASLRWGPSSQCCSVLSAAWAGPEGQAEQGGQKEVLEAAHGACSVGRQSRGGPL
jgi:hypothetical protein